MADIDSTIDRDAPTLTFTMTFDAAPERVWQIWADPRQLERWWGPPTWPATFTRHDMVEGGRSDYFMTGPDGDTSGGLWSVTAVDEPHLFEVEDGFAGEDGEFDRSMPTMRMSVTLDPAPAGTRMTIVSTFASPEELDKLLDMGMRDGMTLALGQIDDVLAS